MYRYLVNPQLDFDQVLALYQAVGWTNYTDQPDRLRQGLDQSLYVLACMDQDRLVGLLRCVGDGETIIFIQDILVLPDYQRQGIGTELLSQTLATYSKVYQMHLCTDDTAKTRAFYESMGFVDLNDWQCLTYTYAPENNQ